MRSSCEGAHISGAERLLDFSQLEDAASSMLKRALNHSRGVPSHITLTLEQVGQEQLRKERLLPLSTFVADNWRHGRLLAVDMLEGLGLERRIVKNAISRLAAGPAPNHEVMRGAMLVDAMSGERLEPDRMRGVRVSRMDIDPAALPSICLLLDSLNLNRQRVLEAWVLASKVTLYPQVIAELCWSDDPDYQPGYVASAQNGYQRITHLKELGSSIGGRIFFVRQAAGLTSLIDSLQYEPLLFREPPLGRD